MLGELLARAIYSSSTFHLSIVWIHQDYFGATTRIACMAALRTHIPIDWDITHHCIYAAD